MKETKQTQLSASGIGKGARVPVAFEAGEESGAVSIRFAGTRAQTAGFEPKGQAAWEVVGAAVVDATYESSEVVFGDHVVQVKTPAGWVSLPYVGPPLSLAAGGKRVAAQPTSAPSRSGSAPSV
ncbi:MAG: hypothetical protein AAB676_04470 [Verrucomicrobiota bacterium]